MLSRLALLLVLLICCICPLNAPGQGCTGLCLQQVSCPGGGTTTISGTVYAPNGSDPIPGALVYIPNAAVARFTPGVSCSNTGQQPSGSPLLGTTTAVDGTFTLANVPVGANIPIVVQSGHWRRQLTVPTVPACANTAFSMNLPRNQSEGDIPRIALVTGKADALECVLRKVGIDDAEFTDPGGTGRVNFFDSNGSKLDASTPNISTLATTVPLANYDVLMLPCEGSAIAKTSEQLQNFVQYANAGGRIYATHFSYTWLYQNPPFDDVVQWTANQNNIPNGTATVDTSFAKGQILSQWLTVTGASTTPGQIPISTLREDFSGLNAGTQSWLTLNNAALGNPVMQFTFDTPINAANTGCGRVLFDEYHVETRTSGSGLIFPSECDTGALTPQERLLEYNLFDLTSDGSPPTLTPSRANFGSVLLNDTSGTQTFTWTNNTPFPVVVSSAFAGGDFHMTGNTCSTVGPAASCVISVTFAPTILGSDNGALTVTANTGPLTAALTGTGISPLTLSAAALDFGKVDITGSAMQSMTLGNNTFLASPLPALTVTGDFTEQTTCASTIAPHSTCAINITFRPSTTGTRSGAISFANASLNLASAALTGTGVDFTLALTPTTGAANAGASVTTDALLSPIAGFANPVSLNCTTSAADSTCNVAAGTTSNTGGANYLVAISTASPFAGEAGVGNGWFGCMVAALTGLLLLHKRFKDNASALLRLGVVTLTLTLAAVGLAGCGNVAVPFAANYTKAGTYTYTITATDGILTHSATFTLDVSIQ